MKTNKFIKGFRVKVYTIAETGLIRFYIAKAIFDIWGKKQNSIPLKLLMQIHVYKIDIKTSNRQTNNKKVKRYS